jgi:hypothetical protein
VTLHFCVGLFLFISVMRPADDDVLGCENQSCLIKYILH